MGATSISDCDDVKVTWVTICKLFTSWYLVTTQQMLGISYYVLVKFSSDSLILPVSLHWLFSLQSTNILSLPNKQSNEQTTDIVLCLLSPLSYPISSFSSFNKVLLCSHYFTFSASIQPLNLNDLRVQIPITVRGYINFHYKLSKQICVSLCIHI